MDKLINELVLLVKNSSVFIGAQLPDVCMQLIRYKIVSLSMCILFCIFFIIVALFVIKIILAEDKKEELRYQKEKSYPYDHSWLFVAIIPCIAIIFLLISICQFGDLLLKASLAPKIYIIEYLKTLI